MDRTFLRLGMALLLQAALAFAAAADRDEPQQSPVNLAPSEQKPSDDSEGWKGFPNKGMREQIRCPQETRKRVEANTYLQLFANKWHDQPEPSKASDLQRAGIMKDAAAISPSGKSRSAREDDYVEILALIGADGEVVDAYVVCSTATELHDVALKAVRASTYTPARVAGNPIASIVRRPYLFSSLSH